MERKKNSLCYKRLDVASKDNHAVTGGGFSPVDDCRGYSRA